MNVIVFKQKIFCHITENRLKTLSPWKYQKKAPITITAVQIWVWVWHIITENHDDEYDGEYDGEYNGEYDGEYDSEYDGEYEEYDGEYDGEYERLFRVCMWFYGWA